MSVLRLVQAIMKGSAFRILQEYAHIGIFVSCYAVETHNILMANLRKIHDLPSIVLRGVCIPIYFNHNLRLLLVLPPTRLVDIAKTTPSDFLFNNVLIMIKFANFKTHTSFSSKSFQSTCSNIFQKWLKH